MILLSPLCLSWVGEAWGSLIACQSRTGDPGPWTSTVTLMLQMRVWDGESYINALEACNGVTKSPPSPLPKFRDPEQIFLASLPGPGAAAR